MHCWDLKVANKLHFPFPSLSSDTIEKPRQMEFKITHLQRIKLFGEGRLGKSNGFANVPLFQN